MGRSRNFRDVRSCHIAVESRYAHAISLTPPSLLTFFMEIAVHWQTGEIRRAIYRRRYRQDGANVKRRCMGVAGESVSGHSGQTVCLTGLARPSRIIGDVEIEPFSGMDNSPFFHLAERPQRCGRSTNPLDKSRGFLVTEMSREKIIKSLLDEISFRIRITPSQTAA